MSNSSRLAVLNSDTTAPSAPPLKPVEGIRRQRILLTGAQHNLVEYRIARLVPGRGVRRRPRGRLAGHV